MFAPLSLQPLLRQPYNRETFQTILEDLFPSGSLHLLQVPEHIAAPCDHVRRTQQLGSVQLPDGNSIALLEVEVEDQVQLARNRVALRNFVARFIDEAATQAVLAVFHQPGKTDWRLTYASKRSQLDEDTLEITSVQTAPRRYTFLLGESEPCRTAAGRLAEIRERDEHLTLEDVEKAFSVERLNKEFFDLYKEHYDRFVAHLLAPERVKAVRTAFGVPFIRDDDDESTAAAQNKADKPIRDFVKRLLGRLVFLHFLQKKGWMGCKAGGKAWTGGDTDFLASYFSLAEAKGEAEQFHSRWLLPLFFEALNTDHDERPGHVFAPTGTRIPYLNGGLFEASEVEQALLPAVSEKGRAGVPASLVDFPAAHFRALLEFFGQYHFTIDENDPEDHEVGIDPEMLGHIFENLLEDNKDKGAYYTPKAIVSYMARQSLLHYLQTHLGENAELITLLNEKDLTRLEKNGFVHQHAKRIAELLDAVKVCDPAIGSGAFPIGVLQEILWTRLALDWTLNTPEDRARLKRQIIQNSIHGVDLDPGAVEIARLRFWLALVVDEDQPRPLPNLDYKIHRADSLIEYIRGEPVHLGKVSAEDKRTHGAIQSLIAAKQSLFTAQRVPEKRAARFALYRALAEVAIAEFTWLRNEMGLIADDAERAFQLDSALKEFTHRLRLIDNAAKESAKIQDRILADLRAWFDDEKKPTFLWQLHFGEVFANGGFDIVIANPPYVSAIDHKRSVGEAQRNLIKTRFSAASGAWDLYVPFFQLGRNLLRNKGTLCLICPNKYLSIPYAVGLREFVHNELCIRSLADVSRVDVFATASVYPVISVFSAENQATSPLAVLTPRESDPMSHDVFGYRSHVFDKTALQMLPDLIWGYLLSPSIAVLTKILLRSKPLSRFAEVNATTTAAEADEYGALLTNSRQSTWRVVNTGTIDPHINLWGIRSLVHQGSKFDHPVFPSTTRAVTTNRRKLYDKPKILFAKMALRFEGFVDANGEFAALNVNCIHTPADGWCLWALNAMLHSKAIHHIYSQYFDALRMAGGYLPFQSPQIRTVPIPPASAADKARLSELAEACAAAAKRGDEETLAVHEAEIDQIVYRLFDLTPEEITLIESSLAPTREKKPGKRSKVARTLPCAESEDTESPTVAPKPASKAKQPHTECAAPSTAKPFLPGELFAMEGELTPAKKAPAAREAASTAGRLRSREANARAPVAQSIPIDQTERNDVLATIREVFNTGGARDRDTALKDLATALGYERLGPRIREVLGNDLRTAVGRDILHNQNGELSLRTRQIGDYDRTTLKKLFLAAISKDGRVWHSRDDAIRLFTRHLGFRRTGSTLDQAARSLINGLLRDGSLEKDGQDWIRRA